MDLTFWTLLFLAVGFSSAFLPKAETSESIRIDESSSQIERLKINSGSLEEKLWTSSIFEDYHTRRDKRSLQMVISQHFTEKTVTTGVDVHLQCTVNGPHPARFIWERDGLVISSNTDSRYAIGQTMAADGAVVTQLNISHIRVDDGGLYSCTAHHGENAVSHFDRVNVYGPPYIRTLPPFKVQSGQSVTLRCPYYGYPIRDITWEYRGKEITSDVQQTNRFKKSVNITAYSIEIYGRKPKLREKRDLATVNTAGVLTIAKVSKSDSGSNYACVVRSPSGEMAKRSFELHVVEPPTLEEILLPSDLQEGQIVQIHCNLKSGDSPVYYSWLKDGRKIPTHLKIVERSLDLFSVLIIKNVALEHCGTYTCVAANHVAKVNRTVNLYIKVAPKWSEEPQNTSLLLGRSGHISCSANGYPQPQTHWLKKDVVSETWRPVLEVAGGGVLSLSNGSLIFDSVALSDAGLYTCHVENGVGEALSKTIWISVNKPVTFDMVSRNLTAKLGQHVSLECQAKGDDPIRIMWTKNGKAINPLTQRVKISEVKTEDGLTNILELLQTETTDGALYQCRAGNPFGADVYSVYLTILEPPTPPTDLSVDSIKSRSVKLSWRDMTRTLAQYYNLQITISQRLSWSTARSINVSRSEDIRHSIEIDDLQPSTSYTARVAGGNQADLSAYSSPVRFTTTEEAPSSPPLSVQLEQTESPGELRVRWLPPPADAHNGIIIGYRLRAVPQLSGVKESEEASDKVIKTASLYSKQETVITGLLKGVRYSVSVAAFNGAGTGPFSIPMFQDTREGAPEEGPSSVECGGMTSTALRVSWQPIPPHKQAGALIGYTVLYAAQGRHWQNATSLVTELRLQGLLKYTNYTIKVAGFSNYGTGPYSFPIVCATMQDVPEAPAEIKLLSQSSNSLMVSWKKPRQPNGRLLHYTVYCKPTASNDRPQTVRVEAPQNADAYERTNTIELKSLDMGTQYDVWVTASTAVGEGPESRRVSNTPSQRVVAGVASLGGEVTVAVRNSLLLECKSVGSPPPRTVWYHNQNIITHHPRFTRNRDDSLLIKSIDQSLSGNYTCLAKNLYGSDSVVYFVRVLPLPDPPSLRSTPYKDSIVVEWDEVRTYGNDSLGGMSYNLTWREGEGPWQEAWPVARENRLPGIQQHTLTGLKCGTKYSIRVTATDSVGTSAPAHIDVTTLGGAPVSPPSTDWLWSNATHIYIQLSGWEDGGCDVTKWEVDYRPLGSNVWHRADNKAPLDLNLGWTYLETRYQAPPLRSMPSSYAVGSLSPAHWYQLRVTATNDAGTASTVYTYATKTLDGEEIGPPSELLDLNMLVIICSSILLVVCLMAFICILFRRHRQNYTTQYRHSIAEEVKSRNESVASHSEHKERYAHAPRIYTSPIHNRKTSKNEMFEISPYAEFALGFRTFDHVENQDLPSRLPSRPRFDSTETSFQTRSESDDSDSTSKATVTALPRPPEEGPSSVECGGMTSTALRVSWQPIPPHKQAGALIGYTVLYAAQGRHWQNATSLVTELRLQGLLKYTNYTIKVAGFSNYGTGPYSFPIVCATMQDVPEAPAEIKLLSQSSNSLMVSWKKPRQPNGRLLHYTVYCKPTASNDRPQTVRVEAPQNADAYERTNTIELKSLEMGTQYDVWVTASTAVGEGPESRRVSNTPSQRVVAGVASLGGEVTVAVRNSLLLECKSVGSPPPRTVWYHNQNIITHHPRFTRNRDDSLLIKSIDQSLSGNYTCLAKNLYGSDSVVYFVRVLPLPDPPSLRSTPYKDSIVVEWDEVRTYGNDSLGGISYNLTWREGEGPWQDAWPVARENRLPGIQQHTLTGLKCGTKYSIRVTATDSVGTSAPAHIDVTTLGGAPVSPPSTDWLWSNATHIYIQLSGWDDGGCDVTKWEVDYRPLGSNVWHRADNKAPLDLNLGWTYLETRYQAPPLRSMPSSYAVGSLSPAHWYQLRVTATNDAGTASTVYTYATKTLDGEEIGPPSELLDLNMLVIICSSILLVVCLMAFICILFRRHRQNYTTQYRHSIAEEVKSRNESVASHSEHKERYAHAPRIYTSPIHNRKTSKNEMFEISPYAEFALGFRTFDHVENQDLPSRLPSRPRFDSTETSFQTRSESDDSDSTSKATVTALPRRHCRTPHHR